MAVLQLACPIIQIPEIPCVQFPGGLKICPSSTSASPPSLEELARLLIAQLNTALAPLQPIFTIVDTVATLIELVQAIATLDPEEIAEAAGKLKDLIVELIKLIPQLSIPVMLLGIIDAIIAFLQGFTAYLESTSARAAAILDAETFAQEMNLAALAEAAICGQAQLDGLLEAASSGMTPINSLFNAVNSFLTVIGLGQYAIPELGEVSMATITPFIEIMNTIIEIMVIIRSAIPL